MAMPASNEEVAEAVEGWEIGYTDGLIICDGCGKRLHLLTEDGQLKDELPSMTGYASLGMGDRWFLPRIYCEECDKTEVRPPTQGADEAIVSFDVKIRKQDGQPVAMNVEVIDRAEPDKGGRG